MNFKQSSKNEDTETSTRVFRLVCTFSSGKEDCVQCGTLETRTETAMPWGCRRGTLQLWKPQGNKTLDFIEREEVLSLVLCKRYD